jgi:hypothetical protein
MNAHVCMCVQVGAVWTGEFLLLLLNRKLSRNFNMDFGHLRVLAPFLEVRACVCTGVFFEYMYVFMYVLTSIQKQRKVMWVAALRRFANDDHSVCACSHVNT